MKDTLDNNIHWQAMTLFTHLKHDLVKFAEQHNLNLSQLQALLSLEPNHPIPMNRLSCMVGCDASYITGVVDKLLALQLITRQESEHDRRIKTIELTEAGVQFREHLIRALSDFSNDYFSAAVSSKDASPTLLDLMNEVAVTRQNKLT